jgi:hypothetical protein
MSVHLLMDALHVQGRIGLPGHPGLDGHTGDPGRMVIIVDQRAQSRED